MLAIGIALITARLTDAGALSPRVVGVADLHGDFEHTVLLLEAAGLIEAIVVGDPLVNSEDGRPFSKYRGARWIGGNATLVQLGDLVDRGTFARDLYALFADLRTQAVAAGGRVVNLIGNHDMMNMMRDLRYVSDGDYAEFGGKELRGAAFTPTGWIGRQILEGFLSAIVISQTLFVHAGLTPAHARDGIDSLNKATREQLLAAASSHSRLPSEEVPLLGSKGPFWVRHFSLGQEHLICSELAETLSLVNATRMVVGHTQVTEGTVRSRCNGSLLMADTIISKSGYPRCWKPRSTQTRRCEASISYVEILGDDAAVVKVRQASGVSDDIDRSDIAYFGLQFKSFHIVALTTGCGAIVLMFLFPGIKRLVYKDDRVVLQSSGFLRRCDDYLLKCVFVGDCLVSKSSLLRLFAGEHLQVICPTGDVDVQVIHDIDVSVNDDGRTATLQLWDCSDDANREHLTTQYFSGSYPIFVFDLTRRGTFDNLQSRWLPIGDDLWQSDQVRLLVGTTLDETADVLPGLAEEAQHLANERGWRFIRLSANADPQRAQDALQSFAKDMRKDYDDRCQ